MKKIATPAFILLTLVSCAKSSYNEVIIPQAVGYKEQAYEYETVKAKNKKSPSLWSEVGGYGVNFIDYQARSVGDIIIVKIVENYKASNSNNINTARDTSYDASIDSVFGLPNDLGIDNFLGMGAPFNPSIKTQSKNTFKGSGNTAKNDSISATIAAVIVEVLPSGNLVIEGQREIVIDQQKQTVTISGVIRQKDIDASNTVASSMIADARIRYSGDGVLTDATRKGWLAVLVDWIWPF